MDKKQFEKLGIIAFILFMLLAIVWGTYKLVKGRKKKEPEKGPPRTLKPLKSAKVEAVKTGATGSGVSGYSFKREYAEGDECTFTPAMNKYVTLNVTLTIEQEEYLAYIDGVRATWKIGNTVLSTKLMSFSPPTSVLGTSLQIPIPAYTDTNINIACNEASSARTDNTIFIEYSSNLTPDYTPWGTITMVQGLGTEITSAFDTIPIGKATDLVITLVAAGVGNVTQEQNIEYTFTVKGSRPQRVITGIKLETGAVENTYKMTYGATTLNIKTYKIEGIADYDGYVAAKVIGGDDKFIYFNQDGTIAYRTDYDDSCFFKIEISYQNCQYTWTAGSCPSNLSCDTPASNRIDTLNITAYPKGGGRECPGLHGSTTTVPGGCSAARDCDSTDCTNQWSDGTCSATTCGTSGKIIKTRVAQRVGKFTCSTSMEDGVCNAPPCPVDCVYGEWSSTPACSTACGKPSINYPSTRTFTPALNGGSCPTPDDGTSTSKTVSCLATPPCTIWDSSRSDENFRVLVSSPAGFRVVIDSSAPGICHFKFYKNTDTLVSGIVTSIQGSAYLFVRFVDSRILVTNGTTTIKYPTSDTYSPGATYLKMTSTNLSEPVLTLNRATDNQAIYRWPVRNTLTFTTSVSLMEENPIVNEEGGGSLVLQENGTLTLYDRAGRNIWTLGTPNPADYQKPYRLSVSGTLALGNVKIFVSGKGTVSAGFFETPSNIWLGAVLTPNRIVVEQDTRSGAGPNAVCIKILSSTSSVIKTLPANPSPH
jgi:hypothetical protein